MSEKERQRLLNDKWPEQSKKNREALLKALRKTSRVGLFETKDHEDREALMR